MTETRRIQPMLAGKFSASKQRFPCYVQPKYDGIRCIVIDGRPYSRSLELIPNEYIRAWFHEYRDYLNGLDGELIVGSPTAPDVYRKTLSGVMSEGGSPDFTFYNFDIVDTLSVYELRRHQLHGRHVRIGQSGKKDLIDRICDVPTKEVFTYESLLVEEADFLSAGYEGAIVRCADGKYKFGRSTTNEGYLLKLKRFIDEEAEVIGFEELMHNENEATLDNFGRTKRSSHQDNKVPGNKLGALVVRNARAQEFRVGTGFDQATRQRIWDNRDDYLGKIIVYRYVTVGGYDLPRFPVFHGFRAPEDMS